MPRTRPSAARCLQALSRCVGLLLVAAIPWACGDDITGPGDLEPNRFQASLSGGMEGSVTGSVSDGILTTDGGDLFLAVELAGRFPDDKQHKMFTVFDLGPSSGTYSVHPRWTPESPALDPGEVGVFFANSQGQATHSGGAGTLDLNAAEGLQGELTVTLVPSGFGADQEIEADVLFRLD